MYAGEMTNVYHPGCKGLYVDNEVPEIVTSQVDQLLENNEKFKSANDTLYADIGTQIEVPNKLVEEKSELYSYIVSSSYDLFSSNNKNTFQVRRDLRYLPKLQMSWFVLQKKGEYNPAHYHPTVPINGIMYFKEWDEKKETLMLIENNDIGDGHRIVNGENKVKVFNFDDGDTTVDTDYPTENACLTVFLNDFPHRFKPKKGLSVVMSADTIHSVNPFYSDQIRYSYQWNIDFVPIPNKIDIDNLPNVEQMNFERAVI